MTEFDDQQGNCTKVSAVPAPKNPNRTATLPAMDKKGKQKILGILVHPFTRMHKIPVFKRVWFFLAVMGVYAGIVDYVAGQGLTSTLFKEAGNAAYMGAVFGLLLVFRTNSAYERWWEGRRLWGQLTNDSRNMALKVKAFIDIPLHEKVMIGELMVSFAYALKHHLRDSRPTKNLPGLKPIKELPESAHLPSQVALRIFETIAAWRDRRMISDYTLLLLDPHARAFMDICGACERIRSSPLAVSYRAFMRQGIALNLLAMPWYVVPSLDVWFSMPIVMIGSYFLIGLELIAEDIEDPFGEDGDDLPLDAICSNIQRTVSEIISTDNGGMASLETSLESDPLKFTKSIKALRIDPLKGEL